MSKVKNIQTGEIKDVADDQLGATLASGEYEAEQGARAFVVDQFGDMKIIDASNITSGAAEQSGMRIATPAEIAERRNEKEYGEGLAILQAAGEGALRGATVGLSDPLLRALGVSAKGLRERKERNPIASGGGEAVGILGSILATGGLGAEAQAAGRGALTAGRVGLGAARVTPAALIARGGIAAERGLATVLGEGALGRAITTGLVGAGEGALYGAGQAVSEAALGDTDLTAERILASAGQGALWGGATAGALSMLGSGIGAAARKVRGKTALEIQLEKAPLRAEESVVADVAKALNIIDEIPATAEQKGFMRRAIQAADDFVQGRRAMRNLEATRDVFAEDVTRWATELEEIRDIVLNYLTIAKKVKAIGQAMRDEAPATPQVVADFVEDGMVSLKEKYWSIVNDTAGKGLYSDYEKGLIRKKLGNYDQHLFRVKKIARYENSAEAGEELFGIYDQAKRDLGEVIDALEGTKYENRVMGKELREYYFNLRDDLTLDEIWGTRAADIQRADNARWTEDLDVKSAYNRFFLTDAGGRKKASGFGQVRAADLEKIKGAIRNADSELNLTNTIMRRSVRAQADLMKQLASSHSGVDIGTHLLVDRADELATKIINRMDEAASIAKSAKAYSKTIESASDLPVWGSMVKTLAWAADNGYRADSAFFNGKIQNTLRDLAGQTRTRADVIRGINKRSESVAATARKAADNFFNVSKRGVVPIVVTQRDKGETLKDRYDKVIKRHDAILNNQGLLVERASQVIDSDIAPNTAAAFSGAAMRAAEFLRSKQPTPNTRPSDIFAHLDDRQRVADSEIAKYLRYVDGVERPVDALKSFGESGDMSRETAEAIRTVYPKLFSEFELSITNKLVDAKEPLAFKDVMRLSLILDRPLHPALESDYIALCQSIYQQKPNETVAPSRRSMPETSKEYQTASQRLEA